jgi:PAS domain S-box-containing protein
MRELQMELLVACILLAIGCAFLLWDRRRLQRRVLGAQNVSNVTKRVADELESERRFLDSIINSIGDPIFVKDREHRYVYVNEAKCRLTGAERDAIIGKTDYDFSRPEKEQIDVFVQRDDIVIKSGQEDINEEALTDAAGNLHTVVTRKSLYTDDAGRRYIVGIIRDVTEHKRIEETLRRSQAAYFAEAQRLSATGSFSWNALTGEIFWSDETCRILGYDPTITPSIEAVMQRVHPEDIAFVKQVIERAARDKQEFDFQHRLLMPDGSVKHLHIVAHLMADEPGKLQFVGAIMDISERHEQQVESSRLAAIVSSSDDAIVGKTLDGTITSWNAGATTIFGYRASEMIGQPIFCIIPPELHDEERDILTRLRKGERIQHYETARIAKDGRRIEVALTISPVFDKSGKVVGASKVARDITATRQAEAELQQARTDLARVARLTTLGELTAAIAHEVNQPLTGLVSSGNACLRWLAGDTPNLEAARRSVERMISDGNRASEVISRIRAMVTKSPPKRDLLNINDAIMEVSALIRAELDRNSISPRFELSNSLPLVWGDRVQLQQVILNLIVNAIEAMSGISQNQRRLLITSMKDGANNVLVTVQDSGAGLDMKSLDQLFEAFYTTKANGMGMGLAVSHTIVQAHGGRLLATPNLPQGAKFQFTLPADGEKAACWHRV